VRRAYRYAADGVSVAREAATVTVSGGDEYATADGPGLPHRAARSVAGAAPGWMLLVAPVPVVGAVVAEPASLA